MNYVVLGSAQTPGVPIRVKRVTFTQRSLMSFLFYKLNLVQNLFSVFQCPNHTGFIFGNCCASGAANGAAVG